MNRPSAAAPRPRRRRTARRGAAATFRRDPQSRRGGGQQQSAFRSRGTPSRIASVAAEVRSPVHGETLATVRNLLFTVERRALVGLRAIRAGVVVRAPRPARQSDHLLLDGVQSSVATVRSGIQGPALYTFARDARHDSDETPCRPPIRRCADRGNPFSEFERIGLPDGPAAFRQAFCAAVTRRRSHALPLPRRLRQTMSYGHRGCRARGNSTRLSSVPGDVPRSARSNARLRADRPRYSPRWTTALRERPDPMFRTDGMPWSADDVALRGDGAYVPTCLARGPDNRLVGCTVTRCAITVTMAGLPGRALEPRAVKGDVVGLHSPAVRDAFTSRELSVLRCLPSG